VEGVQQDSPQAASSQSQVTRRIGWLLLVYLLSWLPAIGRKTLPDTGSIVSVETLDLLHYATTAAMLVVARRSLREFRIDKLSLTFFVVFGAILRIPASPTISKTEPTFWAFSLIAVVLVIAIFRSRSALERWAHASWAWVGLGLISSVGPILLVAVVHTLVTGSPTVMALAAPLSGPALSYLFIYWMGHAAVLEEPAFRGFLWGYLEQHRWSGMRIWLLQAALFWLGHLRYIDNPLLFWVTVPLGGLLLGWLSWHSKSLAPSMVAHAAYNTLGAFL
jgi:membrane protease YdiL (CAAX protease family)